MGAATPAPLLRPDLAGGKLAQWVGQSAGGVKLQRMILQAGMTVTPVEIILRGVLLAAAFAFLGRFLHAIVPPVIAMPLLALIGALLPIWWVLRKREKRLRQFEAQFPDAMEFLARSMRAGHGFLSGLQLISADSPQPLASVFHEAANELNLGAPLDAALAKLSEKVPLLDVRFFASAVFVQQTSGGDLSEILVKLANVIRERLRLRGEVRAASAHGRLTGLVLLILPIALAAFVMITSPAYLINFAAQPEGKSLLLAAALGQALGYFFIRRIVNVKV